MFMKGSTRAISDQIGTPHAPQESDKFRCGTSQATRPGICWKVDRDRFDHDDFSLTWPARKGNLTLDLEELYLFLVLFQTFRVEVPFREVFTVKPLYEGTLAIHWTTAPSILIFRRAQLAPLLLLFLTLTVASRCYASTHAAIVQIDQKLPIRNSKTHTSILALSRIIQSHFVQRKNAAPSSSARSHPTRRRKRETNSQNFNYVLEKGSKVREIERTPRVPGEPYETGTELVLERLSGENVSDVSGTDDLSRVITQKFNRSGSETGGLDERLTSEENLRLMPPVNSQSYNSCKFASFKVRRRVTMSR
ncbi:hypothetical protein HHI36_020768 [Cryptolaemus montrouzieri]|uniref:Uncharacterized protein n=1 Tax=Cryptolaemus montrouzieri TaxID=559131 RepID=A0ABD2NBT3_9CUCU